AVLVERPRVVGGRDLVSGGTWLAVREGEFVSALMNRRPAPGDTRDPTRVRSRGLLCLDVAAADGADSHLDAALRLVRRDSFAPCTLVGVGLDGEAWALEAGADEPRVHAIAPGSHVTTHQDVDDVAEPRTRWILEDIAETRP